jgi:hypothetical protein
MITEMNVETGRVRERELTAAEQRQADADRAAAQERREREDVEQAQRDAARVRRADLAKKARAGTLTAAERDEALALALAR